MQKKTILITGGSGLLATNWASEIKDNYQVILGLHHKKISLEGTQALKISLKNNKDIVDTLIKNHIDIVINTVALTSVELCQQQPELAYQTNIETAKNIALACASTQTKLVHLSTDHLFDGSSSFATEQTPTCPINVYAKTKLEAEKTVLSILPSSLIIRTNFFGNGTSYCHSFSDLIIKTLKDKKTIELFDDVFYTPILASELVKTAHQLIANNTHGVVNIVGDERLSKYEFGLKIADVFELDKTLIKAISIDSKANLVKRPKDMSLSNKNLKNILSIKPITITKQIQALKSNNNPAKLNLIPYGRHYLDNKDIACVVAVLKHGALTQGEQVIQFEQTIASYVGAKYAVALSSGTAALHLSALALDLKKADAVITTSNTFVATSNAILYVGAKPIFVDIDKKTLNIDITALEQVIIDNPNVKAIFPVHFAGLPCQMDKIALIAKKYQLSMVEDAAHALGSTYTNGSKVGNCHYSDMTIFSFHPVKGIAAGEGGMITTNSETLYKKILLLRSHGISKGNFEFPGISQPDNGLINQKYALENGQLKRWYYEMQQLGFNYRITDIQCALANSQMDKIDDFLTRRKQLVKQYDQAFANHSYLKPQQTHARSQSSHHIYLLNIDFDVLNTTRNQFMQKLANQGIGSQVHYIPVVKQPYYQNLGYDIVHYPNCEAYYQRTLSIPLYYGLSNEQQNYIINTLLTLTKK